MPVPTLETPRLILRGHRLSDFGFVAAMWGDPAVVRFIGEGKPLTREDAWNKFQRFPGHWNLMGYGSWAITEKTDGALLGEVGFIARARLPDDPLSNVPEIGWALASPAMGKGYATEAVKAALSWGRDHFGPVRAVAVIQPDNAASLRVARKCGFALCAQSQSGARPLLLLDRPL
jgi:RimJ/RimL family protein N-acetyltransferase